MAKRGLLPDGQKIADLRTKKGLTQRQLADNIEVSEATIRRIENGAKTSRETLELIALELLGTKEIDKLLPQLGDTKWSRIMLKLFILIEEARNAGYPLNLKTELEQNRIVIDGVKDLTMVEGSVLIEMTLTHGDVGRVISAFLRGDLRKHNVVAINIIDSQQNAVFVSKIDNLKFEIWRRIISVIEIKVRETVPPNIIDDEVASVATNAIQRLASLIYKGRPVSQSWAQDIITQIRTGGATLQGLPPLFDLLPETPIVLAGLESLIQFLKHEFVRLHNRYASGSKLNYNETYAGDETSGDDEMSA